MKFTLHLALCLSILLLPLCVQSKNTAGAFSVNRKLFADPEKTDSSSTEEKKDDQVNPPPSVDDKTEEKKDDQVNPPAPVDDKTEEKKDDQVDPTNTQPPAPVDDGKTPAPLDDGDTPVPDKNTTDTSVVQPDGDKSYDLTFQQKLKFLMSPKKPWIYLISGLVGFILIAFIIFGFSRFFVDSEEQEEYNMSTNVEKGRDNSKIQTLQLDFYKQTTEVQIVN